MASISTSRRTTTELLHISTKRRDPKTAERSPEHTKIWTEPHPSTNKPRRVPVVYYLSRNGNLEHPHFIEVPLSVSNGLYLRDVIDRLNALRGKEMAASYSWSSKRSYKNGFVWHDLAENDYIYPAHGQEYILKGSELVNSKSEVPEVSSLSKNTSPDFETHGGDCLLAARHRRNQSCSSIDLHEYKVYSGGSSADAATQTDEKRRRRLATIKPKAEPEIKEDENESSELSREEISPPPSDSSPETLETLMKTNRELIQRPGRDDPNLKINPTDGNKAKASTVLMQLITCGATSFRDCGPGKDNMNFSLLSHYKSRMLPRGKNEDGMVENDVVLRKNRRGKKQMVMEDKEYFSGSLIETKKDEFVGLKRSNSCTTNRHKFSM